MSSELAIRAERLSKRYRLAGLPSDGLPYPLFAYAGLLPWTYFANAVNSGGTSLVANTNLVSKIYFPRLLLPLSSALSGLLDMLVGLGLLLVLTIGFGFVPGPSLLALVPLVLLLAAAAFAISVWLAAVDVRYRDVRYAVPFLIQVWLFATPIAYSSSLVPDRYRTLYALNPMVGVVEGFRWAVLGHGDFPAAMLGVSTAVVALLLVGGLLYFRRVERGFADVI